MRYNNFYFLDGIAVFILLYENVYDNKRILYSIFTLIILLLATAIASIVYIGTLKTGVLLLYGTNILCCNITFRKIKATKFWDILFLAMMIIVLMFGLGTIFRIESLDTLLKTYYVDHLSYFLAHMLEQMKPVTFFVSHSMAAFNYTLFIVVLFIRDRFYQKHIINKVLIVGFVICMIFLRSNSSLMFLFLLYSLYLYYYAKKRISFFTLVIIFGTIIFVVNFILSNIDTISMILTSKENGLLGRFSSESVIMGNSIQFIMDLNFPTGLYNIMYKNEKLLYMDSSYITNMMRGGVLLIITYTYVVICFIKQNICDIAYRHLFILLVLLFDFGYTFTSEQRFLSGFLFMLPYINMLRHKTK